MPKILIAVGNHGKRSDGWNWCDGLGPVGIHGFVCASACRCGCNRSFTGVDSAKATTLAAVAEVDETALVDIRTRLMERVLSGWGSAQIAETALQNFDVLVETLAIYPVDHLLKVEKREGSFTLVAAK